MEGRQTETCHPDREKRVEGRQTETCHPDREKRVEGRQMAVKQISTLRRNLTLYEIPPTFHLDPISIKPF